MSVPPAQRSFSAKSKREPRLAPPRKKRRDEAVRDSLRPDEVAGLPFVPHAHQLRHACGYYLASRGHDTRAIQDYLGHKNIQHTVRYTAMAPHRFESFWND